MAILLLLYKKMILILFDFISVFNIFFEYYLSTFKLFLIYKEKEKEVIHVRIRDLRLSKNWTLSYVASRLNVSTQTICNWERGKTQPDIQSLISIADLYDVSIDYIVGRDNPNSTLVEIKSYIDHMDADVLRQLVYEYINKLGKN